jgi:hypothetical protein
LISAVTLTTVDVVLNLGLTRILGGGVVLALILLLAQHELMMAAGTRFRLVAHNLTVAIAPLLVIFAMIVAGHVVRLP